MRTKTVFFRVLLLLYLAGLCYACFSPGGSLPSLPDDFLGLPSDKVAHFAMFLPFPFILYFSFPAFSMMRRPLPAAFLIFVCGVFLSCATEFIQGFLPERHKDEMDLLADLAAVFLGSVALIFINRR